MARPGDPRVVKVGGDGPPGDGLRCRPGGPPGTLRRQLPALAIPMGWGMPPHLLPARAGRVPVRHPVDGIVDISGRGHNQCDPDRRPGRLRPERGSVPCWRPAWRGDPAPLSCRGRVGGSARGGDRRPLREPTPLPGGVAPARCPRGIAGSRDGRSSAAFLDRHRHTTTPRGVILGLKLVKVVANVPVRKSK